MSKSKSESQQSQSTTQLDSSGVNTGMILQSAGALSYVNNFSEEVQSAFADLVGVVNTSLGLARDAGTIALEGVTRDKDVTQNPEISLARDYLPVFVVGAAALAVITIMKKG